MGKWFSYDSPFIRTLNRITDVMLINLTYLICCIPVLTIGASRAALMNTGYAMAEKEERGVIDYLKRVRGNLKGTFLPWIIFLVGGVFLVWSFGIVFHEESGTGILLKILFALLMIIFLMINSQFFMVMGKFDCGLRATFSNACLIAISHPLRSLVLAVIYAVPYFLFFLAPETFAGLTAVWFLCYFWLEAWISGKLMHSVYQRLILKSTETEEPETAETAAGETVE